MLLITSDTKWSFFHLASPKYAYPNLAEDHGLQLQMKCFLIPAYNPFLKTQWATDVLLITTSLLDLGGDIEPYADKLAMPL